MQNNLEALIPDRNSPLQQLVNVHDDYPRFTTWAPRLSPNAMLDWTYSTSSVNYLYLWIFSCLHSSQLDNRELSLESRRGRLLSITEHRHRLSKEKTLHQHVTPGWREKMGSKVPCPWKGLNTDLQIQRLMCLPQDNHAHTNKLWQVHSKVSRVPFHYFSDVW